MDFLVGFDVSVPDGSPKSEVEELRPQRLAWLARGISFASGARPSHREKGRPSVCTGSMVCSALCRSTGGCGQLSRRSSGTRTIRRARGRACSSCPTHA